MTKLLRSLLFVGGFLLLFFIFLVYLFPFGILKETLVERISSEMGRTVTMERLSLGFPLRVHAEGIEIQHSSPDKESGVSSLKFQKIRAGVSLGALFLGALRSWVEVHGDPEGSMEVAVQFPLGTLLSGGGLPSQIDLTAQSFPLTTLLNYSMDYYGSTPGANPMIAPLLKQLSFQGKLQGEMELSLPSPNPALYQGQMDLKLLNFSFESRDPNLMIPQQNFSEANFIASLEQGKLEISERSRLTSPQLSLGMKGNLQLLQDLRRSPLKLTVPMRMSGDILEQLGILIQMALLQQQEDWDGEMTLNISGHLGSPNIFASQENPLPSTPSSPPPNTQLPPSDPP